MKKDIETQLQAEMNKEKELPSSIRITLDNTYSQIRNKSVKRKKFSWLKPLSAAVVTFSLISGLLLINETVLAKVQSFIGLGDKGIQLAEQNGDVQFIGQTQTSKNTSITLENQFVDAYRYGFDFKIESNQIQANNLYDMSMEYRLFNDKGEEIDALVSDTKPISGIGITSGVEFQFQDNKENQASLSLLADSNINEIPDFNGGKLVIETIHFINQSDEHISIDGEWSFNLQAGPTEKQTFVALNSNKDVELVNATISNGSMRVTYKLDGITHDENDMLSATIVDSNGEEYGSKSANIKIVKETNQTEVSLVFPLSLWSNEEELKLKIKGFEKMQLVRQN